MSQRSEPTPDPRGEPREPQEPVPQSGSLPAFRDTEEARAFLAAIVESSEDAIVGKTLDGIVRSWNRGAERLFGYRADEVIGKSITLLIPPDRQHEERMILERLRRGERISHFETIRVTKSGEEVQISLAVSPIRDASGHLVGASKVARDVGEARRAEEAARRALASLRDSEERFRALADNVAQLAWMADPDGSVTWYNRRWLDYTGGTVEEMRGWGWRRVHHPDHVEAVTASFRQAIARGEEWEETFPLRGIDGEYRWFLSRALPIRDEGGRVVRWFGTNTDISERMRMEATLREADRRKDEFLATLAHELRNPLAPIATSVELLRLAGDRRDVQQRALTTLERQIAHLVRLVDDLLDISRITRGTVDLRPERVELATLVEQAVEATAPHVAERGHRLDVALPAPPGTVTLEVDPTRLVQVLANLLNNAAKYTPPGGHIELDATVEGDAVRVTVSDDGPGIPPELLDTVFEMFVQGAGGQGGGNSGLGIGLTLVRSLVELHGGSVVARPRREGSGTEVELRLPLARSPSPAGAEPPPPVAERSPLRILVVDDNRDAADSLHALLLARGHHCRVVYDGQSALAVAAETRPQLVLLDLGMPEMDGIETARRLREQAGGGELHLVALTGWGQDSDRQRTGDAGFDDHLVKPVDGRRLQAILGALSASATAAGRGDSQF